MSSTFPGIWTVVNHIIQVCPVFCTILTTDISAASHNQRFVFATVLMQWVRNLGTQTRFSSFCMTEPQPLRSLRSPWKSQDKHSEDALLAGSCQSSQSKLGSSPIWAVICCIRSVKNNYALAYCATSKVSWDEMYANGSVYHWPDNNS